jgi:hypothetical protein
MDSENPVETEHGMLPSIRVRGRSRRDELNAFSRVNFAKIYTVEHNVKVFDFGDVHEDYRDLLLHNFNSVWGINDDAEDEEEEEEEEDEEYGEDEEV